MKSNIVDLRISSKEISLDFWQKKYTSKTQGVLYIYIGLGVKNKQKIPQIHEGFEIFTLWVGYLRILKLLPQLLNLLTNSSLTFVRYRHLPKLPVDG